MMKKVLFIVCIILNSIASYLYAEISPDTIAINEVVISGNRIEVNKLNSPVSLTVVSEEVIQSQEESNILPVVTRVTPGLFISEIGTAGYALGNSTSGQLTIRGVGGAPNSEVLMLVDGQPQYMGVFGHPLPNFHMTSNVERVEVVRGPASLLYGSNAMGGVINVITRKQKADGLRFSANAAYGSYNTQKYSGTLAYKKNKFSAGISMHHDQTEGHRDTSAFNITNINTYASYELNDHWKMNGGFMMADYSFQDPGSEENPASLAFLGDISRRMATISLINKYDDTQGGIFAYYNWGQHSFSDGWKSADVNSGLNMYQAYNPWDHGTITAGIDYKNYGGSGSLGFLADTFLRVSELAGYFVADQEIGKLLRINAGLRYEHHSTFGPELIPQAGITVKPNAVMAIKGLISKGFRSPTIMDLYLFAPNADLGPERLWNYEIAWAQSLGKSGVVEMTGFMIQGSNIIEVIPNPNVGPPLIRMNGGEFTNWGFEVESSFSPFRDFRIDANYSMLKSDTKRYFAPEHQFYLGSMYSIGDFKISLNLKTVSELYTYIDSENENNDIKESYALLNTKVIYSLFNNADLFLAVKNILNQSYQTVYGYTMPGINFIGGVSVRIN